MTLLLPMAPWPVSAVAVARSGVQAGASPASGAAPAALGALTPRLLWLHLTLLARRRSRLCAVARSLRCSAVVIGQRAGVAGAGVGICCCCCCCWCHCCCCRCRILWRCCAANRCNPRVVPIMRSFLRHEPAVAVAAEAAAAAAVAAAAVALRCALNPGAQGGQRAQQHLRLRGAGLPPAVGRRPSAHCCCCVCVLDCVLCSCTMWWATRHWQWPRAAKPPLSTPLDSCKFKFEAGVCVWQPSFSNTPHHCTQHQHHRRPTPQLSRATKPTAPARQLQQAPQACCNT
jgi:hypothetical protein